MFPIVDVIPDTGTLKTLQKAIELLRCFDARHQTLGIADVSRQLGLPRSVVSRIATTLRAGGLLEQDPGTRRYRIGLGLFELGSRYTARHRWFPLALETVTHLVGLTGHAAYIGVLTGADVVVLAVEEGDHRVQLIVNRGERFPAYSTAIGKALLARLSPQQISSLYGDGALSRVTERTVPDVPALRAELTKVRTRRYATVDQETFKGIKAAGVSFVDAAAGASFAISISYPIPSVSRQDERGIVDALIAAGERLGHLLGDPWWERVRAG